jgi:hypothetical protein
MIVRGCIQFLCVVGLVFLQDAFRTGWTFTGLAVPVNLLLWVPITAWDILSDRSRHDVLQTIRQKVLGENIHASLGNDTV